MNKTLKAAAVLLAAAGITACASHRAAADPRNPKPDWVDGSSMEYPREQYVIGVGAADDEATAEDRARGEIAKVFSSNVSVDTTVNEMESNMGENGKTKSAFSQQVAESVHTTSKKVIEGAEIVEKWQDPASRVRYALAVVDRSKAAAALTEKLGALDAQTVQYKQQMDSADGRVAKAKAGMRVLRLLKARHELAGELRVVSPAGAAAKASPVDEAAVKAEANKAVAALDVAVELSGDGGPEIETGVVSGLGGFGLQAAKGANDKADLHVAGQVDTKAMQGDGSKWQWARSTVAVTVKQPSTGKIIARFDASDREASADYNEAVRRCHVELAKQVAAKLSAAITSYFEE